MEGQNQKIEEKIKSIGQIANIKYQRPVNRNEEYVKNLFQSQDALLYLVRDRGFTLDTIKHFQLGLNEKNRLTIPIYKNGVLIDYKFRTLPPEEKSFFRTLNSETYIFNEDGLNEARKKNEICIVESETDCMTLYQFGFKNVISLHGGCNHIGPWIKELEDISKVFIILDSDEPGQKAAKKLAEHIGLEKCYNVVLPVKDANDFFKKYIAENFENLLLNARKFPIEDVLTLGDFIDEVRENRNQKKDFQFGYPQLDKITGGFNRGNLIILSAYTNHGKCLRGNTKIVMADGSYKNIKECKANDKILSLDKNQKIIKSIVKNNICNGLKDIYKLKTQTGRIIYLTKNHPLLIGKNWKTVGNLKVGDRIATLLKSCFGNKSVPRFKARILGYLIAGGRLSKNNNLRFTKKEKIICKDFETCVNGFDDKVCWTLYRNAYDGCISRLKNNHQSSNIKQWLSQINIPLVNSREKRLSNDVFRWNKSSLKEFLKALFTCDGSCFVNHRGNIGISYSTTSLNLAQQIQSLLIKFGIISIIRFRKQQINNNPYKNYEIVINHAYEIRKFINKIGFIGKKYLKSKKILKIITNINSCRSHIDVLPRAYIKLLKEKKREYAPFNRKIYSSGVLGYIDRLNKFGKTISRIRAKSYINLFQNDNELLKWCNSDILWDKIVLIKKLKKKDYVYDLEIKKYHNFIANNVIVHNSVLSQNFCMNFCDHNWPSMYVPLEDNYKYVARRMLNIFSKVEVGTIPDDQWDAMKQDMIRFPLYIYTGQEKFDLEVFKKLIEVGKKLYNIEIFIIDHIHFLAKRSRNMVEEIGFIMRELVSICRNQNVSIIAISHIRKRQNEEGREFNIKKMPTMDDLKDSSSTAQDAHMVLMLLQQDLSQYDVLTGHMIKEDMRIELAVQKNREGMTTFSGKNLQFDYHRFIGLVEEHIDEEQPENKSLV